MPRNVPPELEDKFKSCKEKLLADGKSEDSAYAICYTSVVEGKSMKDAIKEYDMKYGATISASNMKKVQSTHDFMVDLGASCGEKEEEKSIKFSLKSFKQYEMTGAEYAIHEGWDIQQCCSVCSQVSMMCQDEIREGEMDEAMLLCNICMSLIDYCKGECQEMIDSINKGKSESYTAKSFAIPKDNKLNLSYVKSLGIDIVPNKLAVKYVSKDTIRHPVFIWGSKDRTDLEGEFFTRDTNFWDDILGKSARPLTWDHAQDPEFKSNPLIGKTIEWDDDDIARWAISILDTSHKYRKAIDALIEKKSLGSAAIAFPIVGASSDTAPQYVERVKVGKSTWLARWPWFATALTVTPCEPLMVAEGMDTAFVKSLGVKLPDSFEYQKRYETLKRQSEFLKLKNER